MCCRRNVNSAVNGILRISLFKVRSYSDVGRNAVVLAVEHLNVKHFIEKCISSILAVAYIEARCIVIGFGKVKNGPAVICRVGTDFGPLILKACYLVGIRCLCRYRKCFNVLDRKVGYNGRLIIKAEFNERNTDITLITLGILQPELCRNTHDVADFGIGLRIHFKVHIHSAFFRNRKIRIS